MNTASRACLLAALWLTGCGGDPTADTVADLCTRLDDCNLLPDGVSVPDCIDNRAACVEDLSSSQGDDWLELMDSCMDLQSCSLFKDCWLNVPWC